MIILIDGYNVLKQVLPATQISQAQRQQFIEQLRRYGKLKSHKIVLVFDAGPFDRPTKERSEGIDIVYSGVRETADDYLRSYMTQHKNQDILLITSDRVLRNQAISLKIESLPAVEFYRLLQQALQEYTQGKQQQAQFIKTSEIEDTQVDELMTGSNVIPKKSEDVVPVPQRRSVNQISKQERQILKKIKKL